MPNLSRTPVKPRMGTSNPPPSTPLPEITVAKEEPLKIAPTPPSEEEEKGDSLAETSTKKQPPTVLECIRKALTILDSWNDRKAGKVEAKLAEAKRLLEMGAEQALKETNIAENHTHRPTVLEADTPSIAGLVREVIKEELATVAKEMADFKTKLKDITDITNKAVPATPTYASVTAAHTKTSPKQTRPRVEATE